MPELELALRDLGGGLDWPVEPEREHVLLRRIREAPVRRRLRASLAPICKIQGRNGAPGRKRWSADQAFTNPSWAASSASAGLPAMR